MYSIFLNAFREKPFSLSYFGLSKCFFFDTVLDSIDSQYCAWCVRSKINDAQSPLRRTTCRNYCECFIGNGESHAHFDRSAVVLDIVEDDAGNARMHARQRSSNMQTMHARFFFFFFFFFFFLSRRVDAYLASAKTFRNEFWRSYFYGVSRMIRDNRESRFKNWFYRGSRFYAFTRFAITYLPVECTNRKRRALIRLSLANGLEGREEYRRAPFRRESNSTRVSWFLSRLFSPWWLQNVAHFIQNFICSLLSHSVLCQFTR